MLKAKIKYFFKEIFDLIYKQKCVVCGCSKTNEILCKNCSKDVQKLSPYAQRIISSVQIFSAYKYENSIKTLIKNLKFNHAKRGAVACAELLFDYYKNLNLNIDTKNTIIVPVPSHPIRVFARGYCHLELIVKEFSKLCEIEYDFNFIKKVKNTRPQYKLKINQRAKNVRGAFKLNLDNKTDKTILLIDDLVTTGATLEEIIKEIKTHKNNKIIVLTIACA